MSKVATPWILVAVMLTGCGGLKKANQIDLQSESGEAVVASSFEPDPEQGCEKAGTEACTVNPFSAAANLHMLGMYGACADMLAPLADKHRANYIHVVEPDEESISKGNVEISIPKDKVKGDYYRCARQRE